MAKNKGPKPANQGGKGAAPTQGVKAQPVPKAKSPKMPGEVKFASQPGGVGGSRKK